MTLGGGSQPVPGGSGQHHAVAVVVYGGSRSSAGRRGATTTISAAVVAAASAAPVIGRGFAVAPSRALDGPGVAVPLGPHLAVGRGLAGVAEVEIDDLASTVR